jgi:DnaJ-domain-containing protein 1
LSAQGNQIEQLKRAYRALDIPEAASALAIKSNYRKLIKRWHPDRPATGAATSEEAMMMTKLINEAYALIENAPLRYYSSAKAPLNAAAGKKTVERKQATETKIRDVNEVDLSNMFFNERRIEYSVRVVCGSISGAFVGMALVMDFSFNPTWIMAGIMAGAIGFAAGAVKFGDTFWRVIFGNWWTWE